MTADQDSAAQAFAGRWKALGVLLAAVFMDMVDSQIVNVALPTIQHDLGARPAALQWIVTGYTLAFAVTLITGGHLGDRYGRRVMFMVGAAGFGAASLAAGGAPNVAVLLAARAAQGLGAGIMVPQVLAFIRSEFPAVEQAKAMACYGATFPLGGIAGPVLGGVLTQADLFGWRWRAVFLVNAPVAIAAVIGAAVFMPARARSRRELRDADVVGVALLAAALLALVYPLVQGRESGWPSWAFGLMAVAVPLFAVFFSQQRARSQRGQVAIVRLELFRERAMSVGLLVMLIFYCGMGAFFVLTLHLQDGLHYSPLKTALTMLPATVGIVAGNAIGMPMAHRLGRILPMAGLVLLLAGAGSVIAVVSGFAADLSPWALAGPVTLYGEGLGVGASSLMLITLTGVGSDDVGAASGLVNTVVQLGMAAGPATVGTAFFSRLAAGSGFVAAAETGLLVALCLFAAALLACLLLPRTKESTPPNARAKARAGSGSGSVG